MNPIWIQNRWLLFLKPVFHFWLRILWFDCDFVFTSLYYFFFCSFRGKSNLFIFLVYIQSKVSYHWEFVVTAGVLNLWGTCGTRPLNLSLLLHCCPTVHWGVCFSPGPFSESSSLSLLSSFSALTTGKGLWEILQFFCLFPCAVSMLQWFLCTSFFISWPFGLPIAVVPLAAQGAIIYWLPPCSSVC